MVHSMPRIVKRVDAEVIGRAKSILLELDYNVKTIPRQIFPFDIAAKKLNEAYLIDVKHVHPKEKWGMGIQIPSPWPKRAKFIIEELKRREINCKALIMVIVADRNEYFCLEPKFEIEEFYKWSTGTYGGLGSVIEDLVEFFKNSY